MQQEILSQLKEEGVIAMEDMLRKIAVRKQKENIYAKLGRDESKWHDRIEEMGPSGIGELKALDLGLTLARSVKPYESRYSRSIYRMMDSLERRGKVARIMNKRATWVYITCWRKGKPYFPRLSKWLLYRPDVWGYAKKHQGYISLRTRNDDNNYWIVSIGKPLGWKTRNRKLRPRS